MMDSDHQQEKKQPPNKKLKQHDKISDEVKDLGRKARARLQEERGKRREICRLKEEENPIVVAAAEHKPDSKRNSISIVNPIITDSNKTKKKIAPVRKRRRRSSNNRDEDNTKVDDCNVDRWIPDTSHISASTNSNETRSSIVQLHGVPVGTTPNQIKRFFSGLNPHRIVILLPQSCNSLYEIPDLDSKAICLRKKGLAIDRYNPTMYRILVKFDSSPTAELACQRSGEVIPFIKDNAGASIAVTHMRKHMANYLIKKLAIDTLHQPGCPIDTSLHDIQSKLDPIVSDILWSATIRDLKFKTLQPPLSYAQHGRKDNDNCCSKFTLYKHRLRPQSTLTPDQIQWLNEYRENIQKEHDRLLNTPPFPSAESSLDPSLIHNDPIMTLTCNCANVLKMEIEQVDTLLTIASRWDILSSTRTKFQKMTV